MEHICVRWIHDDATSPIWLYSELDSDRWEVRKVEIWANGKMSWADASHEGNDIYLGQMPVPSIAEIEAQGEFVPKVITQDEFEGVWQSAIARSASEK